VNGTLFYLTTLLVYAGVDMIACLGLSIQFGVAGVTNFGFIIFQAAGAYTAGILSLSSDKSNGGFQSYIGGLHLPFPIPWIGAAIVGGLLALPFTFIVGKRLRGDFAAIGLLVAAVVTNFRPFLNGSAGLSLVPAPLQGKYDPQSVSYQLIYSAGAVLIALLVYFFLRRLTESPYGRTLRAMRDNDIVADSLGKNLLSLRTSTLVLGGAIAGLSGGLLVGFINLWSPAGWGYAETVVLFAAVIIGGAGNHKGAMFGAIVVPLAFEELTRFIPAFGPPGLIPALQWVAIGLLIVLFLWFRPQGLLPERRRVTPGFANDAVLATDLGSDESVAEWSLPGAGSAARALVSDRQPITQAKSTPEAILQVFNLTRSFDGVMAVNGVSFDVQRGRLTGLIGPNGAGKSTTLAMLAGTLPVTSGRILYKGDDITALPAFRRARSGIVRTFQLASEFKRLTVLENLLCAVPQQSGDSFYGALLGRRSWIEDEQAAIDNAAEMLERFGLTKYANTYAGDLSGGQRRLVEIMRALMTDPTVLLLDEPMAGVHPHLARQIGKELIELSKEGMAIMMVEHELAIMDEFCDPVIVMAEGTVLAEGTMASLRAKPEVVEAYLVG
jgi:branched-chain amino acid transport system permease protein